MTSATELAGQRRFSRHEVSFFEPIGVSHMMQTPLDIDRLASYDASQVDCRSTKLRGVV